MVRSAFTRHCICPIVRYTQKKEGRKAEKKLLSALHCQRTCRVAAARRAGEYIMTTTSNDGPASHRHRRDTPQIILPPLNDATITRAREGLAAARDTRARAAVSDSLANAELLTKGQADRKMNSGLRRFILRVFINLLFRVQVEHPENIPTGPAILAPNHLNHIDPFLVLSTTHDKPYYYTVGDARTLYNKRWKRLFVQLVGGLIPVDRMWKEESAVIEAARQGHAELAKLAADLENDVPTGASIDILRQMDRIIDAIFAQGNALFIFPEGSLGMQEGVLRLPLKRGTVRYALRAGVPIVPVGLIGTHDLFLRKKLIVRYGTPLVFPHVPRPKPREEQAALDALQTAMLNLIDVDYQEPSGLKLFHKLLNRMFL
jgi:1-acyl-sn-glycerol-3-phosphate acyltransferase